MAFQSVGLQTSIWNNNIRSAVMIAIYPLTITIMVWCIAVLAGAVLSYGDGLSEYYSSATEEPEYEADYEEDEDGNTWLVQERIDDGAEPESYEADWNQMYEDGVATANDFIASYWPAVFGVVGVWFLIAGFFHTRMIRMLSHARPVNRAQEPELYNTLENLCIARGLPMPKLEIIETPARNAFASGIDESSYTITVTRGLLQSLQKDEVEAVLGHELTHIMNNDVRLLIISIIFTGMIGFICQLYWSFVHHSLRGRGKKDGRLVLAMMAIGVVLWLGYIVTTLTRFAISRRREFMADAGSVELTKNPEALMRALLRIAGSDRIPGATEDIAMMCIENNHQFLGMFSTHPKLDDRLLAISEATQTPLPHIEPGRGAAGSFERAPSGATPDVQKKDPWA